MSSGIRKISPSCKVLTEPLSSFTPSLGSMQKRMVILFIALGIFMLVAGCTMLPQSKNTTSQPTVSVQKTATETVAVQTPQTLVTTLVPDTTLAQNQTVPTTVPSVTPTLREGDTILPYVSNLAFKDYYLATDIPGCDMKELFPAYANDPAYGIEQPVPKLSTIAESEMRTFVRDHTLLGSESSAFKGSFSCKGVSMSPDWNFAQIHATITPRIAKSATYEISYIMKSRGKNITVFTSQETLTPDQPLNLVRYIPMKLDEMELLDIPYVTFTQLTTPVPTTPLNTSPVQQEIVDPNVLVFTRVRKPVLYPPVSCTMDGRGKCCFVRYGVYQSFGQDNLYPDRDSP